MPRSFEPTADTTGGDEREPPGRRRTQPADADEAASDRLTVGSYVRLTVLNRVSLLGLLLTVVGGLVVFLTSPTGPVPGDRPLLGGGLLLVGLVVFTLGFTLGQRTAGKRGGW